jgi:cytochrome c oxidase subunit IV
MNHSPFSVKKYSYTYLALLILLGATFVSAHLNFGLMNLPLSIIIAFLKAFLILLYFMQIRHSSGLRRILAGAGIFWLGVLILLTLTDFVSRNWLLLPSQWP